MLFGGILGVHPDIRARGLGDTDSYGETYLRESCTEALHRPQTAAAGGGGTFHAYGTCRLRRNGHGGVLFEHPKKRCAGGLLPCTVGAVLQPDQDSEAIEYSKERLKKVKERI